MAWFSRKERSEPSANTEPDIVAAAAEEADPELPLRPSIERIGADEIDRLRECRTALREAGIDTNDLDALGRAFDDALSAWLSAGKGERANERDLVEMFAVGIGDHLEDHTDLTWSRVTDAFGTDLAVAGGKDDFTVVPSNVVAVRWMNQETGWVPGVVGHLVRVRESR